MRKDWPVNRQACVSLIRSSETLAHSPFVRLRETA
jgi:hypothetical protein